LDAAQKAKLEGAAGRKSRPRTKERFSDAGAPLPGKAIAAEGGDGRAGKFSILRDRTGTFSQAGVRAREKTLAAEGRSSCLGKAGLTLKGAVPGNCLAPCTGVKEIAQVVFRSSQGVKKTRRILSRRCHNTSK